MEIMSLTRKFGDISFHVNGARSHSAQDMASNVYSSSMKIPLPPRLWITDVSNDSSEESGSGLRDESVKSAEKSRVRSRIRHKHRSMVAVPIGIFWDIENCQVPRGCSALDVVSAIRSKFLVGRREADFVVVCDVRKETTWRLQELNDAQVSLIHVCGTQKNAADEKLRQCMRRFGELHSAPASLLLISGDINFAADLSDFRYRKNMEVLLVHKQNTSSALIACATSHYCYNEMTASLPRNPKIMSQTSIEEEATCEMEVNNLPPHQPAERVSRRLRRLADNCGGKVLKVLANTAVLRFPTTDHASRALKRMDGEDVFGNKIGTRYIRSAALPAMMHAYSSDEGYATGTNQPPATPRLITPPQVYSRPVQNDGPHCMQHVPPPEPVGGSRPISGEWSFSLQHLPPPPPPNLYAPQPPQLMRKIRGTHGSNPEQSCSSNSGDESAGRLAVSANNSRAVSPWNSSCFSEQSGDDEIAELTVTNLPPYGSGELQDMLFKLFSGHVTVVRVSVWLSGEGPAATVAVRGEFEARLAIARLHKRRLNSPWAGRRLELSLGRPSPAPNLEVLRTRLRAILIDQFNHRMPLLPLKDAYASRYCSALTTSDLSKLKDTVVLHEGFGRTVELLDLRPLSSPSPALEGGEGGWRCGAHSTSYEDHTRILTHVFIDLNTLNRNTNILLETHNGVLPLLSYIECYESAFPRLQTDNEQGVSLELLLRNLPNLVVRDSPTRHITWARHRSDTPSPSSSSNNGSVDRERPRTAPVLEPMLSFFERELVDLLKATKHCSLPFSKLIPEFHHHFGRQCRVADYGFTKLPDLLAALNKTIVVLGSGSSRIITLSAAAQKRRWTSDLLKILRTYNGRPISKYELPKLYETVHNRPFSPSNYGVCHVHELMDMVTPQTVVFEEDGTIGLPRRAPTPAEKARSSEFAIEAIELLRQTPNLRIEFSRFVPSFHAHFGRQLRVAHFGCVKLAELIDLVPEAVIIGPGFGNGADKDIRLAMQTARTVLLQRISMMTPVPLSSFANDYAIKFGAPPLPDILGVETIEELVISAGAFINNGVVHVLAESQPNVNASLAAAAAIIADRSITARGSSEEYFIKTFKELTGTEPDLLMLVYNGVITASEGRVQLTPTWRAIYRVATIMATRNLPLTVPEIYVEYTRKYEPDFPYSELGFSGLIEFLRHNQEVFAEDSTRHFRMRGGLSVLKSNPGEIYQDFSIYDTPPGQKGSRVFESPRNNIWCSPPASALPSPSALLTHDARRRTRLAAQFNAAI